VKTTRYRGAGYPSRPEKRFEQRVAELFEFAPRPDLHLPGAAAGDDLKVGELHLEGDSTAANTGALAIPPHLAGDFPKRIPHGFAGEKIGGNCILGADGLRVRSARTGRSSMPRAAQ